MKLIQIYLIASSFFFSSCSASKVQNNNSNTDTLELENFLARIIEEEKIPGAIAAVFNSKGLLDIHSVGVRHIDSTQKILKNDKFHIGSCTKAMTSALIQILISKGKLSWNTNIGEVFPELKNSIHPDYQKITIHELVTHRAGISQNVKDYALYPKLDIVDRRLRIFQDNSQDPIPFNKGSFNYSNYGYMIAGCMIEKITGKSWEYLMSNYLFEPLGMNTAGFGIPGTLGKIDQPWGHNFYIGSQIQEKLQPKQVDNPPSIGPAGTVHCSIEDWGKFTTLFLNTDNEILNTKDIESLLTPVKKYACGWGVVKRKWARGTAISHSGSNTSWYTSVWIAPNIDRIFMVGINYGGENSGAVCKKIIKKLIDIYLNETSR